jgi:hypothetical protein
MTGSDKDHGTSRRSGADERGWSSTDRILDGRTIKRSGDVVCGLYRTQGAEECGFLGLALKPRLTVCQWVEFPGLGLKTGNFGLVIWASKSSRWFLGLGIKTKQATVFSVASQN